MALLLPLSKTGICRKCLFGTTGDHCEKCLPGYRRNVKKVGEEGSDSEAGNDQAEMTYARGCQPCYCDPQGTLALPGGVEGALGVCNEETGQCPCKPGITGLRCDKCRDGFYGFDSGKVGDSHNFHFIITFCRNSRNCGGECQRSFIKKPHTTTYCSYEGCFSGKPSG